MAKGHIIACLFDDVVGLAERWWEDDRGWMERVKMQKGAGGLAQYRSGGASAFILFLLRRCDAFVFPRWPYLDIRRTTSVTVLLRENTCRALPYRLRLENPQIRPPSSGASFALFNSF